MNSFLRPAWRHLRNAKPTTYLLLLLGPIFIRPLAFVRHPDQSQPAYAKLPGLWVTPFSVATLCASIVQSAYEWIFWKEISKAELAVPAADLFLKMHSDRWKFYWGGFFFAVMIVYVMAFLRWVYHLGTTSVLRRWWPEVIKPPFKYFVVTTAAWGLWISVSIYSVISGVWQSHGEFNVFINAFVAEYKMAVVVVFLAIGVMFRVASKNSHLGLKAVYGGKKRLMYPIMLIPIIALGLAVKAFA
ncbi:hypothetical protein [Pseudomonas sp. ZB1P45]|uniref:hypothetical protein n=1 Tax=Pseudomonas frigoris TaxID=3398356 RepID=UPI0039EE0F44